MIVKFVVTADGEIFYVLDPRSGAWNGAQSLDGKNPFADRYRQIYILNLR